MWEFENLKMGCDFQILFRHKFKYNVLLYVQILNYLIFKLSHFQIV